jgi:hypothetical protein
MIGKGKNRIIEQRRKDLKKKMSKVAYKSTLKKKSAYKRSTYQIESIHCLLLGTTAE